MKRKCIASLLALVLLIGGCGSTSTQTANVENSATAEKSVVEEEPQEEIEQRDEAEEEKKEEDTIIKEKTYGDTDKIVFQTAVDSKGKKKMNVYVYANDGWKAGWAYTIYFLQIGTLLYDTDVSLSLISASQEPSASFMYIKGLGEIGMVDGEKIENISEWAANEAKNAPDGELSKWMTELDDAYYDFTEQSKPVKIALYEDDTVSVTFTGLDSTGASFSIENKSAESIEVIARSLAINGKSTDDVHMSTDIAPLATGDGKAKCTTFSDVTDIETISGEFVVYPDGKVSRAYSITFAETVK